MRNKNKWWNVNAHTSVLIDLLKEWNRPIKMAEIGVYECRNARTILRNVGFLIEEYWGVDKYNTTFPAGYTLQFKNNTDETWNERYLGACKYMPFFPQFRILKTESEKAAALFPPKYFPDGYFDFIYIDADHTYEAVKKDIHAWYRLLKIGGYMGGHDYGFPEVAVKHNGVKKAVDEIFSFYPSIYEIAGVWLIHKSEDTIYNKI